MCGALLLATMLNYMDRQTLSLTATQLKSEINLNDGRYGALEEWFSYSFAAGGIFFGFLIRQSADSGVVTTPAARARSSAWWGWSPSTERHGTGPGCACASSLRSRMSDSRPSSSLALSA